MEPTFQVKTQTFEGPLDLLLSLIEKRKLLINEITLSQIADDYLAYVRSIADMPLKDTAQFLLVASTLVLIKSRSLLPSLPLTTEEERSIGDLERRLKLYEQYRALSVGLKDRFGKTMLFARREGGAQVHVFAPDQETTTPSVRSAVAGVIARFPKAVVLPQVVVKKIMSIEDMMERLRTRVSTALKMSFKDFVGKTATEKKEVIVGFLALLELMREGVIDAVQHARFDDISVESQEVGVPKYL